MPRHRHTVEQIVSKLREAEVSRDKYFKIDARAMASGQESQRGLNRAWLPIPYDGGTKTKDCGA